MPGLDERTLVRDGTILLAAWYYGKLYLAVQDGEFGLLAAAGFALLLPIAAAVAVREGKKHQPEIPT